MPDLLSCPFCGKDAQIAPDEIGSGGQHVPPYHAGCFRGAGCGIAFTADDPDEAIAAWNRRALSTVTPAEVGGLVERLRERAESYRMGGPSSEHTAALLDEAATALTTERAAHAETKRERDELKADINSYAEASSNLATELFKAEAQRDEALKDVVWLLDAFQDEREAFLVRELRDGDLPPEWHRAARRVREGGKADG